ncbi:MAG: diguanylate cyclase [Pseudobutyrivibrio sp.]|nr:diguanylate cyclase [Pseudobutyrivibrio sp.]
MASKVNDIVSNIDYSAQDILYMLRDLPDACCIFQVVTDPFGTVKDMLFLFVNEKYASLVGKSTSELIGSTYYSTVSNRDEDWIRLTYQAAFMRQSVINSTYNTQFNKWFEFWAVPVYKKGFCAFIIHDVTAEKRKEENRVITNKSNKFIIDCAKVLSANDFKTGIKYALQELGTALKADRVCVLEVIEGEIGGVYEWYDRFSGTGLPSKKAFEKYDLPTMWKSQLGTEKVAIIEDTSEIKGINSEVYSTVLKGNVSRYIVGSLTDKDGIIGFLLADNYSLDIDIDIKEVVESLLIFISEELRIHKMTQEITYINNHDKLTDLGNRDAFDSAVTLLDGMDVSVGICFIDINGLRKVNEEHGHNEGDAVIRQTAEGIVSAFKKKYCYRIGGDEFTVLIPHITKEHFEEQVQKLERKSKKFSVAIGALWSDDAKNVNDLINQADRLMYADKAAYYMEHDRRND